MKKIWAKFVKSGKDVYEGLNFTEIAARVPPNQMPQYVEFLKKNQMYRARMMKYPRYLPKIDWDFYRANVRDSYRDWVSDFEKQYQKLNQIFDSRHEMIDMTLYYKDIDDEEKELKKEIEDFQRASCARMEEFEKEMERVKKLTDFSDMTWEDYCIAYPEEAPDYRNKPTFWPHTPDEQTPGPSGIHTIEEENKESDSKKPPPDGGKPSKPEGGTPPASTPSGKPGSEPKSETKPSDAKATKEAKPSEPEKKSAPKAMAQFSDVSGESKQSVVSIFSNEAKPMEAKMDNEVYGKLIIVSEEESIFKKIKERNPPFTPGTEEHKVQEISSENESKIPYKINFDKSSNDISDNLIANKEIGPSKEFMEQMLVQNAETVSKPDEEPKSQGASGEQVGIQTESKVPESDITDSQSDSLKDPIGSKKMLEEMKEAFTKSKDFDPLMGHEGLKVLPKQIDNLAESKSIKAMGMDMKSDTKEYNILLNKELPHPFINKDTTITSESTQNEDPNRTNITFIGQSSFEPEGPKLEKLSDNIGDLIPYQAKSDTDIKSLQDDVKVESSSNPEDKYDITIIKGSTGQDQIISESGLDKKTGSEIFKGLSTIQESDGKDTSYSTIGDEASDQVYANAELAQVISQLKTGFDIKSSQDNQGEGEQPTGEDKMRWGLIRDEKYSKDFQEVARNVSQLLDIANKSLAEAKVVHKDKLKALEEITKQTSRAAERASKEAEKALQAARKLLKRAKSGNVELDEKTISMAKKHALLAESLAERALDLKKETVKVLEEIQKRQKDQSKKPKP